MEIRVKNYFLESVKRFLTITFIIAFFAELFFFPSLKNLFGCLMAGISFSVFRYFLKSRYVINFPFGFLMFSSMFLYRFLPLIATIIEGKPISYGFENSIETFIYETFLFLIGAFAFFVANRNSINPCENNVIQKVLYKLNFFKISNSTLWILGLFGFIVKFSILSAGNAEYGDVGGKFFAGLEYLIYAPLILFFPKLISIQNFTKKKWLWIYTGIVFLMSIATNSREQIIAPFAIIILLYFIYSVREGLRITSLISLPRILILGFIIFFGIQTISDLSMAMLYTRSIRGDIGKKELLEETLDTFGDKKLLKELNATVKGERTELTNYQQGWTEVYIDNFMLNRYANMRISDQTLYLAGIVGYGNSKMQNYFLNRLLALVPTPIIGLFDIDLNKEDLQYSPGDLLISLKTGSSIFASYRVSSHIAIGFATFGFFYFILQFFVWVLVFKLLNTYIIFINGEVIYSAFGLMNIFTFLGMFRNSGGMMLDVSFIIRGYIQGVFTYLIAFILANFVCTIFFKERKRDYSNKSIQN